MHMHASFLFAVALVLPGNAAGGEKSGADKARRQILDLTNKERADESLPALKPNATLMAVAQQHAENMARQEKAAHVLDGKADKDRAKKAGYPGVVGENVSRSQRVGAEEAAANAVAGWMKSPGHRANILQKTYTEIGTGMAKSQSGRWYLCQLFGLPTAGDTKIFARVENRAGETIRFELTKGARPHEVANRTGFGVPVTLPKEGMVIRLLAPDPTGAATPITLRNGERYVVTKDGKEYKVRKMP